MKRTHDNFYLKENNKNIKQSFEEVADEIEKFDFKTIADVGCAAGAFPNYISQRFPNAETTGIEFKESLIIKASTDFPHLSFVKGNVLEKNSIKRKFDIITMMGVLCIFDDYKNVLENTLSWLEPKGKLILHNMISDYDIDVFVRYSASSAGAKPHELESGWNIISQKSLSLVVEENNARIRSTKPFSLDIDLEKQSDVIRSWTETNILGQRDIYNALHIRQPQKIVVIEKLS
jgi:predicted TPR repeat methyltransferase